MSFDENDRDDDVELHGWTLVKETDAAYGVRADSDGEVVWLPKSQVRDGNIEHADVGDEDIWFVIPRWLADDRGIDYDE